MADDTGAATPLEWLWPGKCFICQPAESDEHGTEVTVRPMSRRAEATFTCLPSDPMSPLSPSSSLQLGFQVDLQEGAERRPVYEHQAQRRSNGESTPSGSSEIGGARQHRDLALGGFPAPPEPKALGERNVLRNLMKSFIERAVTGVACEMLDLETGLVSSCTYRIDERLQLLTFETVEATAGVEVLSECPASVTSSATSGTLDTKGSRPSRSSRGPQEWLKTKLGRRRSSEESVVSGNLPPTPEGGVQAAEASADSSSSFGAVATEPVPLTPTAPSVSDAADGSSPQSAQISCLQTNCRPCPLSCVNAVYRPEDCEAPFPEGLMNVLNADQRKRLVMVCYTSNLVEKQKVCFLESTATDRQRFLTCMRILRRYMDEQAILAKRGGPVGPLGAGHGPGGRRSDFR